ncbi:MAG: Bax inhibitor-1/YccA family protein [Candidatus Babeliaceae bacterium]|nr:Bax inhibitor-1/YccA family protein [Candidatus Babeliaceae bacterium]
MDRYNNLPDHQHAVYVGTFFAQVFAWMSFGLALTATVSWFIFYQKPQILDHLMQSPFLLMGLFIIQLGLVFWFSASVLKMSFGSALTIFLLYAFLNGITFSGIFFTYTQESIALTFGICAAIFLIMALFGHTTNINLTPIGFFGLMILIGLIITMLINWFVQSSMLEMIISVIGIVLFSALTAYDIQQLRLFADQLQSGKNQSITHRVALLGALKLYLDVINLFVMLLSFTGKRRD